MTTHPQETGAEELQPQRRRAKWLVPVALAGTGVVVGAAAGAGIGFVVGHQDVDRLESLLANSRERADGLQDHVREVEAWADEVEMTLKAAETELGQREDAVAAREEAVGVVEQQVAANSIGEGIWTVGVDVEPGTYRTAEAISGYCYWAIYRSGTNGDDIIENDGPEGGYPTVTLSPGQDFENGGCGTFVRQ